jgi:hypothetical protein
MTAITDKDIDRSYPVLSLLVVAESCALGLEDLEDRHRNKVFGSLAKVFEHIIKLAEETRDAIEFVKRAVDDGSDGAVDNGDNS